LRALNAQGLAGAAQGIGRTVALLKRLAQMIPDEGGSDIAGIRSAHAIDNHGNTRARVKIVGVFIQQAFPAGMADLADFKHGGNGGRSWCHYERFMAVLGQTGSHEAAENAIIAS
jgi:hypothetical protein